MSINISIPLDALDNPNVAQAMADLMLALGNLDRAATGRRQTRATVSTSGDESGTLPARRPRGRPRKPRMAKPVEGETLTEKYANFVAGLPERSQKFLQALRQRRVLTMHDALEVLGVTVPKTMGGVTGSISRWAPQRGVPVPYEASTNEAGERMWTWTLTEIDQGGSQELGRSTKVVNSTQTEGGEAGRHHARAAGGKRSSKRNSGDDSQEAIDLGELSDEARRLFSDHRYAKFLHDMRDLSRRFILLLSERGEMTMSEALQEFGLTRANAMGGVIGPLKRRAQDFGLVVPFHTDTTETGERIWRWQNPLDPISEEASSEEEETTTSFSGVRVRRKGEQVTTPL